MKQELSQSKSFKALERISLLLAIVFLAITLLGFPTGVKASRTGIPSQPTSTCCVSGTIVAKAKRGPSNPKTYLMISKDSEKKLELNNGPFAVVDVTGLDTSRFNVGQAIDVKGRLGIVDVDELKRLEEQVSLGKMLTDEEWRLFVLHSDIAELLSGVNGGKLPHKIYYIIASEIQKAPHGG